MQFIEINNEIYLNEIRTVIARKMDWTGLPGLDWLAGCMTGLFTMYKCNSNNSDLKRL